MFCSVTCRPFDDNITDDLIGKELERCKKSLLSFFNLSPLRTRSLNEQDKLDKKEKYRKQIIQDYEKLNYAEKFIVDYCLNNNTLVCNQIWMKREDSCSLAKKGFGKAESFGDTFFIYRECTDILNQYQREQNSIEKENKKVRKVKK